ncbi:branched-chain amino acid transport system ATP-binding protein [Roseovarius sp. MBR-78]|jgi:branched-chain amino acid transport system ATP-binding protein|uniref:ABC transporter ATP-binding protein n=1 Tax=Roseovarius sp. MBR-78 TaxID=3156460 RepID=UPI0033993DBA
MAISAAPAQTAQHMPRAVLSARGLSKKFGNFQAVQDVDIDIHHGRVHALIGPNGAGKSTVFNLLTKFHQPSGGQILFDDTDITRLDPARVARLGIARSFQISAIFGDMSLLENVCIALQRTKGLSTQFWRPLASLNRLRPRALDLLDQVGLAPMADRRAADLSYGRKRALEIATTLALEPRVLLLDEPLAGMGQEDVEAMAGLIATVAKDCAVLMVEHNIKVVADIGQDITVLQRGQILARGDYVQVSNDPRVREAYMGAEDDD